MRQKKAKPGDEQLTYNEKADPVERASAISRLAVDGYKQMQPFLEDLISHPHFLLRSEAISVLLGGWKLKEYFEKAVEMLHKDSEAGVRSSAAFALTQFATRSTEGEKYEGLVKQELLKALLNDNDWGVQESCYEKLYRMITKKHFSVTSSKFNRERDVDWNLLKPYLEKYNLHKPS